MAKKKVKKKVGHTRTVDEGGKTVIEDVEAEVEESEGKPVEAAPAHVPPTVVTVRGTSVGGTTVMTAEEHDEYRKTGKLPVVDDLADDAADEGE